MSKIIGIDLGTTNSCVAVMEGGDAVVIPNAEGNRTTPSVVAFSKDGERMVGQVAKRQAITNPDRTVISIKREMGTDYKVDIDGKKYTPQEISAMILQKLKTDAEAYLGQTVSEAVITVPAYFTDAQRQATKDAGKIAGLEVKRIINEPTAAALAYGVDKETAQKVMVYDLGGGTFDVSILDIDDGVIEVLATAGNNRLGGDDFDKCVMDWMAAEFKKTEGIDLTGDKVAMQRLKEAAEKAKIELSGVTSTNINLPYITADATGPKHLDLTLTRAKFDQLTAHLVEATAGPVRQAMSDAGLTGNDIQKVLRKVAGRENEPGRPMPDLPLIAYYREQGVAADPNQPVVLSEAVRFVNEERVWGMDKAMRLTTIPVALTYSILMLGWDRATLDRMTLAWFGYIAPLYRKHSRFVVPYVLDGERVEVRASISAPREVLTSSEPMADDGKRLWGARTMVEVTTQALYGVTTQIQDYLTVGGVAEILGA